MNCRDFEAVVHELAAETLIEASKYKLALAHKTSCARCAAQLANQRSLTRALKATTEADTTPAPAHIKAALLQAFAEQSQHPAAPFQSSSIVSKAAADFNNKPANILPDQPQAGTPAVGQRLSRWALAAAAALLIALLGVVALRLMPEHPSQTPAQAEKNPTNSEAPGQQDMSSTPQNQDQPEAIANQASTHPRVGTRDQRIARSGKRRAAQRTAEREATTGYLPLTYVADATAMESGHVVRMMVPRATLIALGVPVSAERGDDTVKADVVVGDDGVARAIRFVYPITSARSQ